MEKKIDWSSVFKKGALILGIGVAVCEIGANFIDLKNLHNATNIKIAGPKED